MLFFRVLCFHCLNLTITRDPSGLLPLSDSQRSMLAAWKRPGEIFESGQVIYPGGGHSLDLMQDVVTDCSVVASLCSAIGREEKGFGKACTPPSPLHA